MSLSSSILLRRSVRLCQWSSRTASSAFSSSASPNSSETHTFSPLEILSRKREGEELSGEEISFFVNGYAKDEIPDYQASAFLMATCLRGMTARETADLTHAMTHSGTVCDHSDIEGAKVDKHSTGGVGDKISLVLAPIVASFGCKVPMMSGRGLGHTGGTLDKLESIAGFDINLSEDHFKDILRDTGCAIVSTTAEMAPADRKFYALRDVTATVRSIALQTASIMSKKLAENPDSLVLDVKTGRGAFNHEFEESLALAKSMIAAGERSGKPTTAFVTTMDEPIGNAIGNFVEVAESVQTLRGHGPKDLELLTVLQAGQMLAQAGAADGLEDGARKAQASLRDGSALAAWNDMVRAQGGAEEFVEHFVSAACGEGGKATDATALLLPGEALPGLAYEAADVVYEGDAEAVVGAVDSLELGLTAVMVGAGRSVMGEEVEKAAGILLHKKRGDAVRPGEALCTVYFNPASTTRDTPSADSAAVVAAVKRAGNAFSFNGGDDGAAAPLVRCMVDGNGVALDGAELEALVARLGYEL